MSELRPLSLFVIQLQQAAPRIVSRSPMQAKSACLVDRLTSVGAKRLLSLFVIYATIASLELFDD
ncbi:hypothetical protein E2R51_18650 [Jeotgalibacillus sp. S-D1]|uniref:hypothetical protein n=1 Tax=Jeotgalibacillus sp. S-D1 TaxID=2552189 RepID=UPI00105A2369|nr:hypothetical protein [Jeotgalibacillus sp. S-D1]TDL30429.1 hypothetical protein E2R51_18650 [Jeotgalibacillus sp. S-D1]